MESREVFVCTMFCWVTLRFVVALSVVVCNGDSLEFDYSGSSVLMTAYMMNRNRIGATLSPCLTPTVEDIAIWIYRSKM